MAATPPPPPKRGFLFYTAFKKKTPPVREGGCDVITIIMMRLFRIVSHTDGVSHPFYFLYIYMFGFGGGCGGHQWAWPEGGASEVGAGGSDRLSNDKRGSKSKIWKWLGGNYKKKKLPTTIETGNVKGRTRVFPVAMIHQWIHFPDLFHSKGLLEMSLEYDPTISIIHSHGF